MRTFLTIALIAGGALVIWKYASKKQAGITPSQPRIGVSSPEALAAAGEPVGVSEFDPTVTPANEVGAQQYRAAYTPAPYAPAFGPDENQPDTTTETVM